MKTYLGMKFEDDEIIDFGSIIMLDWKPTVNDKGIGQYMLLAKDISKLNKITNADNGSVCWVVDESSVYSLMEGKWVKAGETE